MLSDNKIRRIFYNDTWWYSVVDIVALLSQSKRPRKYWSDLKSKLAKDGFGDLLKEIKQLKLSSSDEKHYATDCISSNDAANLIKIIPTKE